MVGNQSGIYGARAALASVLMMLAAPSIAFAQASGIAVYLGIPSGSYLTKVTVATSSRLPTPAAEVVWTKKDQTLTVSEGKATVSITGKDDGGKDAKPTDELLAGAYFLVLDMQAPGGGEFILPIHLDKFTGQQTNNSFEKSRQAWLRAHTHWYKRTESGQGRDRQVSVESAASPDGPPGFTLDTSGTQVDRYSLLTYTTRVSNRPRAGGKTWHVPPIFLHQDEDPIGKNAAWYKLETGFFFTSYGVNKFATLEATTQDYRFPVIRAGEGDIIDPNSDPEYISLPRDIVERHWAELRHSINSPTDLFWDMYQRVHPVFGVSLDQFHSTSPSGTTTSATGYFAGLGLNLTPYVNFAAGAAFVPLDRGLSAPRGAWGFTLDIGKILNFINNPK